MPPKQYHYSSPPLNTSPIMADTVTMANSTFPFAHSINQSTLMTPSRSSDDIAAFDKRSAHNALERQRREGLNTKFQQLAHALPELQNVKRPSKSMIVAKSLEFVAKSIQKDSSYKKKILQLRKEHEVLRKHTKMSQQQIRKRLLDDTASTTTGLTTHAPQQQISTTPKKSSFVSSEKEKVDSPSMKRHKSNKHPSPPTSPNRPVMTTDISKKVNHGMNHKFVHHHMSTISEINSNNYNNSNNSNNHIQNDDGKNKTKYSNNVIIKHQKTSPIDNEANEIAIKKSKLTEDVKPVKKNKQTNVNITTTTNNPIVSIATPLNKSSTLSMMPLQQSPLPLNVFPVVNESWPPLDISAFQNTSQPSMSHIYEPYIVQHHMIPQPHSIPSTLSTDHIDSNTFSSTIPMTQYYTTTNSNSTTAIPTSFQHSNIQDPSLSFL